MEEEKPSTLAGGQSVLRPGHNCWRAGHAGRASIVVDAADYYRLAREAMLTAKEQILLIGWDFDTRVRLVDKKGPSGGPVHLGPLLTWLSRQRPDLEIYIIAWDEGLLSVPMRGTTFFRLLRWWADRKISIKWDGVHPLHGSHHQKILVVDDAMAFCGGIDITGGRWDTRRHRDKEPGRRRPFTHRSYEPWHDAIMAVDGPAARALGDLGRLRWRMATGEELAAPSAGTDPWPGELEPHLREVEIGIARTRAGEEEDEIREVEALFVDMIAAAQSLVYIETQYFASRLIGEAIAKRLEEPNPPEFVVVNPRTASGWLDEAVMSPARYELMKALEARDPSGRFRIYTPVTESGTDIYVHAKIMIVDDIYLRVGSANMNNRSMGLDSECDILVDGSGGREDVARTIREIRADLLAEHLAVDPEQVAKSHEETGSLIATIERLRGHGRTLMPFTPEEPGTLEKKIAKSEALDPEAAGLFEPRSRPGLLSRLGSFRRRKR